MIKDLRRKFILISMCSTFFVLVVILGALNIFTYRKTVEREDELLEVLKNNQGEFPAEPPNGEPGEKPPKHFGNKQGFSPETRYETRFFTVEVDKAGNPGEADVSRIASVDEIQAREIAGEVLRQEKKRGFWSQYRYLKTEGENSGKIIFLDVNRDKTNFYMVLATSVGVAVLGLFMVFVLVMFFSRLVFKPVAESLEKQKRFITDASHELKTPLTIINANMEVLEMEQGESAWIESTRKQTERLTSLTEKMVTLARIDEKGVPRLQVDFSLSDAVEETAEGFRAPALACGKELVTRVESGLTCCGDEKEIRQLVSLLLDNGIKYADEGGKIQVKLEQKGRVLRLIVENPASGLEAGSQELLFERFYRRDGSRNSQTGGTGIGLSVAKAIVEVHRGKIWAVSDGKNLSIVSEIPRVCRKNKRL